MVRSPPWPHRYVAALKAAVAAGGVGPQSRVVLLVTGDGLKTPGPVAHTYDPIMIEADADAFIDGLKKKSKIEVLI